MTDASIQALNILRSPDHLQWYLIPSLAFVLYVYFVEVEKRNWNAVLTGLLFYAAEFGWEMLNALVLHFTQRSAVWTTPGETAYLILVGLNIEISMMFAVAGLIVVKSLPGDRAKKLLGLPNRLVVPMAWGLFCAFVEVLLNRGGLLVWEYPWWNWPNAYLVFVGYTTPFLMITWAHDRFEIKAKIVLLGIWAAVDVVMWVVFVNILGWI